MRPFDVGLVVLLSAMSASPAVRAGPPPQLSVVVAPRVAAVERSGITGGGVPVASGDRVLLFYPNHPDDFGGSGGTASSLSDDAGRRWTALDDDRPLPDMVDVWADPLPDGSWLAFGLGWVPDPQRRTELGPGDVPTDAYHAAFSRDAGRTWTVERATIEYPPEIGVVARPLPHVVVLNDRRLVMPAYAWGKHGHSALLLESTDGGRRWTRAATICTTSDLVQAGIPPRTPWLETTVARTTDGDLLAAVRTGSAADSPLAAVRSGDGGRTWSAPEPWTAGASRSRVAGKLPTLTLLPDGVLLLLTAHSRNHCRLYVSADGRGREWSEPYVVTSQSGGNAGMCAASRDSVFISTPMNGRIHVWRVTVGPSSETAAELPPPTDVAFRDGVLTWNPAPGAAAYRVTPVLQRLPPAADPATELLRYATIETAGPKTELDLSRQLLVGGEYEFEVRAIDRDGRTSPGAKSRTAQVMR